MAHTDPVLVETVAQQLAAELEAYQRLLEDLRAGGWSIEAAISLAAAAEHVQRGAEILPRVAVPLAEFVITRTELARRIVGARERRAETLAALHAEHLYATSVLRRAALRVAAGAR